MMLTFRAGNVAVLVIFLSFAAACSREQQDWRSAESADTTEGYSRFLQRHPDSELATEARTRVAQLAEDHEWQQASQTDTADAYRQFLAQHLNGKWSQEARIRIQNFALNGLPPAGAPVAEAAAPAGGTPAMTSSATASGGSAPATSSSVMPGAGSTPAGTSPATPGGASASAPASSAAQAFAAPGELAQPASGTGVSGSGGSATPAAAARAPEVALGTPFVSTPNNTTGYGVQLGAFTSEGAANSAWQQLAAHFGTELQGLSAHVVTANTASGTLFRLQALVADESRARALCEMLRKQSQACVPVLPH